MSAHLVSLGGPRDIAIDRVLLVVGRHPHCDVRLDSPRVSRRHCCLAIDRDGVLVRDLGSTNGIRINGVSVEVGLLRPGDVLAIAQYRFRLELRADVTIEVRAVILPIAIDEATGSGLVPRETIPDESSLSVAAGIDPRN